MATQSGLSSIFIYDKIIKKIINYHTYSGTRRPATNIYYIYKYNIKNICMHVFTLRVFFLYSNI